MCNRVLEILFRYTQVLFAPLKRHINSTGEAITVSTLEKVCTPKSATGCQRARAKCHKYCEGEASIAHPNFGGTAPPGAGLSGDISDARKQPASVSHYAAAHKTVVRHFCVVFERKDWGNNSCQQARNTRARPCVDTGSAISASGSAAALGCKCAGHRQGRKSGNECIIARRRQNFRTATRASAGTTLSTRSTGSASGAVDARSISMLSPTLAPRTGFERIEKPPLTLEAPARNK